MTNFVLISPILVNRWPIKSLQLHSLNYILPKRKLSHYLFASNYKQRDYQNFQNTPGWKSSWFRRDIMNVIKQCIAAICRLLTHVINLSLSIGTVPDKIKIAKVILVYKKDDPKVFSNYRLISILPRFSKFFERIIFNHFQDYIDKYCILSSHQYGFRKHHSICLAMINLFENISSALDNKEFAVGIFLLSKAFDTVNHKILFEKLFHYGLITWSCLRLGAKLFPR